MPTKLTKQLLKQYGFRREKDEDRNNDVYYTWYKNIELFEHDNDFDFATVYREDDSFKSGYNIPTLERLKMLYQGLTGNELTTQ